MRLTEEKTPEVLWNRKWTPICGHLFWNNEYGPNLFCQRLDAKFKYGKVTKRLDKVIESDARKDRNRREGRGSRNVGGGQNRGLRQQFCDLHFGEILLQVGRPSRKYIYGVEYWQKRNIPCMAKLLLCSFRTLTTAR